VKLGITFFVLFAPFTNIDLVMDAHQTLQRNRDKDQVAISEKRFAGLREAVKPFGTVGYISDAIPGSDEDTGNFYLTQYALAPVIVTMETNRQWVVGNFWKTGKVPPFVRNGRLSLWKDFRDGVALFQKEGQ
jgi:hypothetical protein